MKETLITTEIIEAFAKKLRVWGTVMYIDVETGEGYEKTINAHDLSKEDIKKIAEWMGETIYLNAIDEYSICINPDQDEVEVGIWEEIK